MSGEEDALLELSERYGAPLLDLWGQSSIVLEDGFDLDELHDLSRANGYRIRALLGEERIAIPIGDAVPEPEDVARAASLATLDRLSAEVRSASSGTAIVRLLSHEVAEVEVSFLRFR
jgi:hypothetical protein